MNYEMLINQAEDFVTKYMHEHINPALLFHDNSQTESVVSITRQLAKHYEVNDKDFFILARTDAIAPEGLDKALERAEKYLKAGADGVYLEGVENEKQIKKIGETFKGVPLATSVLERGGETPWLSPKEFGELGYSMILYPTTVLFQYTYAVQKALGNLLKEKPMPKDSSVTMKEFEKIVDMQYWAKIEKEFS